MSQKIIDLSCIALVVVALLPFAHALAYQVSVFNTSETYGDSQTQMILGVHYNRTDFYKDDALGLYVVAEENETRLYIRDGWGGWNSTDLLRGPGSLNISLYTDHLIVTSYLADLNVTLPFEPLLISLGSSYDERYKAWGSSITEVPNASSAGPDCSPRRVVGEEYEAIADSYARLERMNLTKYSIGKTVKGRDIMAYELGSGPSFVFTGRLHGIEDSGTQNGIAFLEWAQQAHPRVRLIFIPDINLDNQVGRVNAHGVDLNRNFPEGWTSLPDNGYSYSGPYPASEPEAKALIDFLNRTRPAVYMDVHQGQQLFRWQQDTELTARLNVSQETRSFYGVRKIGTSTNGYVMKTAQLYANNSFLLESGYWDELPASRLCYLSEYYPRQEELYRAIVEALE